MEDYQIRIFGLRSKGYCCSQIIMQLSLDLVEKNNEELVDSLKGLCNGMHSGGVCGCLSAGAVALATLLPEDYPKTVAELVDWFKNEYGTVNCSELLAGKVKTEVCPDLICRTYEKIREIYYESTEEV